MFELAQLIQFDFALDIGFNVIDVTLRTAQQMADGAGDFGKAFGSQHDQRHDANYDQFRKADIKHASAAWLDQAG
ncbi:hypothetical protein D558_1556 [Bordetella holmesii 44057]|nr:hypothetical protein D560_1565 [Bordetella holmesii ATCC 51541]AIT26228.1 hypothetical protein D558_1556 [Bordetella holmesii 44057]